METEDGGGEITILSAQGPQGDKHEAFRAVLPISVDKFFDLFLGENAEYNYYQHLESQGKYADKLTK